jgi:hypothetical protein
MLKGQTATEDNLYNHPMVIEVHGPIASMSVAAWG